MTRVEWPTVALIAATYILWALATTALAAQALWLAVPAAAVLIALHSSLTHEAIHGHPTPWPRLNAALLFPALALVLPYGRFRDLHLAHHRDSRLTDPYDDPESNYLDRADWARLPGAVRAVLAAQNTLLGRVLIGPALGTALFLARDLRLIGDRRVRAAWALHLPAAALVIAWLASTGAMPLWSYALAVYLALGLLRIRTFLEHRAHEAAEARTVIVEDRGPLALLFLNNNFHLVHHRHPRAPWYRLPAIYFADRDRFLALNRGYRYASYGEVFRRHLLRAKDPVPHPLWSRRA